METQKISFTRQVHTQIILGNEIIKEFVVKLTRMVSGKQYVIVTNNSIAKWYLEPLIAELRSKGINTESIVIQDSENSKSFQTLGEILARLCELNLDKTCPIIALGGGVICDISGLAASIYKRGLPLVLFPTSLLAMVDACIGGKNAINFPLGKNLVGTIYQPRLVAIDVSILRTLPLSQLSYGLVEAVKHGLIADAPYYKFIFRNLNDIKLKQPALMQRLIRRSITLKKSFLLEDELDQAERLHLNFGHTFGHSLEVVGNYTRLHHAEAVGLGIILALKVSASLNILQEDYSKSFSKILTELSLPTEVPSEFDLKDIIEATRQDKKKDAESYNFVLPVKLGKTIIHKVPSTKLVEFLSLAFEKFTTGNQT